MVGLSVERRENCRGINSAIYHAIEREKPDKIVLAAAWHKYDWKKVELTVTELQRLGVGEIYLIGPVPHWKDSLPKQLLSYFRSDALHRLPHRMSFGLEDGLQEFDENMASFARRLRIGYLSPIQALCNPEGCMTRLDDTGESLTAWDYGHFTSAGSRFVVSKLPIQ